MIKLFQRLLFLVTLFLVCYLCSVLFFKKNLREFGDKRNQSKLRKVEVAYEPEVYDLQSTPLLESESIQLLLRLDQERTQLVKQARQSVVCISTEGVQRRRFQRQGVVGEQLTPVRDVASGVIVSKQGHIVTNHHVISGKSRFVVTLHNGYEYNARLIGTDSTLDIAVLRLETKALNFKPMPFGDSEKVKVGQTVFAMGNPFGLGEAVTQGIISAKERSFSDEQGDLFQTDAAINPGNSGGPLVNVKGELIGINVAIFASDRGQPQSQGVGFSIPSNEVLRSFQQIAEKGRPVRGYLGVKLMDLTPEVRVYLDYKKFGVAVTEVTKGSPAEKGGLKPRDVILHYDGQKIEAKDQLIRLIQSSALEKSIDIHFWRNGQILGLQVKVLDSLELTNEPRDSIKDQKYKEVMGRVASIGLRVRELEWLEKRRGGDVGVMVAAIQSGSMAARTGLRRGDRVISMNGEPLRDTDQFYKFIKDAKVGEPMTIVVQRNSQSVKIKFSLK